MVKWIGGGVNAELLKKLYNPRYFAYSVHEPYKFSNYTVFFIIII